MDLSKLNRMLIVGLFFAACTALSADAKRPQPVPRLPAIFPPKSVILFQGDSITHGGRGWDMNHYLGHGYQALIAQCYLAYQPEFQLQFINRAKSGDTTEKLLKRWDQDALKLTVSERGYGTVFNGKEGAVELKPDVLSLLVGVNDRRGSAAQYEKNLKELLDRSLAANPKLKIILGEPFRCPQVTDIDYSKMQGACARLALKYHLPLIPYQRLFNERLMRMNPNPSYWSWDTVHPTYAAHTVMADCWIRTVNDFYSSSVINTAVIPQAKLENDSYDWYARHQKILLNQKRINPEIVLIGDSITHFWTGRSQAGRLSIGEPKESEPHFNEVFSKYRVLNMGFGWDRTQNVLWRLDHGEMDGLKPRIVVLHIGTNNIGGSQNARANTPSEIADAILCICSRIHEKSPTSQILLMGIFPRQPKKTDFWRGQAAKTNKILKDAVKDHPLITYLDIGEKLVEKDGSISREIMFDFCHPTPKGYAIWAEAIRPYLEKK